MAHIPMDDTDVLWKETMQKNWGAFQETLKKHKGKTNGISDTLIDMMMQVSQKMDSSGAPFPQSAQELNQVLNENLPQS
ncbi:MAG TPA: hypothetical protein VMW25_04675 [Clostridia bacterium]|nr:hypothetical protein [Clostridia bacterium]